MEEYGRSQIIQEQKDLSQNSKIIAGSTATGGLILGSGIVGLLDEKGSVQDATTLTKNNAQIAYDAEMAARLQLIQDGTSSNVVDNQQLINEYNDQLTKGTTIKNTDVSLVEGLFNENYLKADATTNITNKTDIYLDQGSQKKTINLVTHEDAHQAGFGEKSSEALGWMGEATFNVNSWVNSSNIDTAKTQIQNIPKVEIAGVNDAQAQKDLLNANQSQLGLQQALGDEFNDRQPSYARANKIDERLGQDVKTHSSVIFGSDKSVLLAAPTIANDLKIAGKCKTDSECNNMAARLNMGEKKYFIASERDSKRIQAEVLITQLGGDFRNYVNSNPEVRNMVIQLLSNAQKEPAVDISQLYNLAEGLAYVRMYKDSGVMPPKGFISALGESHNLGKASKFDEVIRKNSTAYPQDFAIDDLKVPGRQIDTALTIAGSVLTVADIAFIGANGLKAFTAMKAAKTAEKAELAATKVSNNFNADLPNVLDGNPNAPADFALGNKKAVDINAGVNNPHYDSKHGAYTRLEQQYERAMKGTNPQTGAKGAPADASKFFNSTDMKTAIDQAETLYKQNPAKYTQPNGSISVNITFRRPIGEGYIGNTKANIKSNQPIGEYRWSNTATVNIDRNTGKAFTAFPNVKLGVTKPDPLKLR